MLSLKGGDDKLTGIFVVGFFAVDCCAFYEVFDEEVWILLIEMLVGDQRC